MLKQALIAVLLAVTVSNGAHSSVLHASNHYGPAHRALESTGHAGENSIRVQTLAAPIQYASHGDHGWPASSQHHSDQSCGFGHVHCCASTAILMDCAGMPAAELKLPRLGRGGVVPYGQLSHPPLRPPRIAA
jgi:hypothetical protein